LAFAATAPFDKRRCGHHQQSAVQQETTDDSPHLGGSKKLSCDALSADGTSSVAETISTTGMAKQQENLGKTLRKGPKTGENAVVAFSHHAYWI
jgi:hypothetical protein